MRDFGYTKKFELPKDLGIMEVNTLVDGKKLTCLFLFVLAPLGYCRMNAFGEHAAVFINPSMVTIHQE